MTGRAIVTGAARGIGAAIAERLAADGYVVVRVDVMGVDGIEVCDITDIGAVRALAERVGPVDVLVNNAGIWRFAALEDVDPADFAHVLDVNVRGTFHCTQAFGHGMLEAGRGAIVNIASIAALHPNPSVGAYSASKAGVVALTRQTALEWGPRGVRCNAVAPGLVPTSWRGLSTTTRRCGGRGRRPFRCAGWPSRRRSPTWSPSWCRQRRRT